MVENAETAAMPGPNADWPVSPCTADAKNNLMALSLWSYLSNHPATIGVCLSKRRITNQRLQNRKPTQRKHHGHSTAKYESAGRSASLRLWFCGLVICAIHSISIRVALCGSCRAVFPAMVRDVCAAQFALALRGGGCYNPFCTWR